MADSSENIIEIKNLFFKYSRQNEYILDNVTLNIPKRQWVALIGHNGSGKSTLARIIDGLLKAESGEIKISNMIMNEKNVWDIRAKIGMVFQNPDNQFVGSDVESDIAFGLENQSISRNDMIERISMALKAVKMEKFAKREPARLSGGQKQRVAIAGVLALRPEIVILDEATSMLDPEGRKGLIELIQSLKEKYGFTVISITHDIDEASLADRVIVLDDGKIIDDGKPEEIFVKNSELLNIGLDIPFVEKIKRQLMKKGISVPNKYFTEEEMVEWLCQFKRTI